MQSSFSTLYMNQLYFNFSKNVTKKSSNPISKDILETLSDSTDVAKKSEKLFVS